MTGARINFATAVATALSVSVVILFIRQSSEAAFWNDFLSNMLATTLGGMIGVPITLLLAGWQEGLSERERKSKMLRLLQDELKLNLEALDQWRKSNRELYDIIAVEAFLKDELWAAFSDGGELQWIKDLVILNHLSEAYHSIRSVKSILGRYITLAACRRERFLGEIAATSWVRRQW